MLIEAIPLQRQEAVVNNEPMVGVEKAVPRFEFIPVGSPDIPLPFVSKPVRAHFNPGMARVMVDIPPKEIGVAISRVMTDEHDDSKADKTNHLSISTYELGSSGIEKTEVVGVVNPDSLLTPDQQEAGYNLEDFRLTYLKDQNTLMACMSVVNPVDSLPMLGYLTANPTLKDGKLELDFGKVDLVLDEKGDSILGKNNIMRIADDGSTVMMYRPEFLIENGERIENYGTFRFISVDIKNPNTASHTVGKGMVVPQLNDGVGRWGWNGNNGQNDFIDDNGDSICVMHRDIKGPALDNPNLDDTYLFKVGRFKNMPDGSVVCIGMYTDDFLTPTDIERFTGVKNTFNPKKSVIYSPGSDVNVDAGELVIGVAYEDTGWGYITVPLKHIKAFMETSEFIKNPLYKEDKDVIVAA